ncbi:hypothetical protein [Streptacidiphilus sp. EB129]|uniref:hypothetical protein n=1 Tax=Streptacidiphilus sp. EB129 TaxID=3156262 RepID=UPI003513D67F
MTDMLLVVVPGLLGAFGIAMMVAVVLRMRRLRAAWNSGITAEGSCVAAYVVTTITTTRGQHGVSSNSSSAWHHVYEFTASDGQVRRFKEAGGPNTVVRGDRVVIRYPAGRPDRATGIPPSEQPKQLLLTAVALAFLTLFVAFSVFMGFQMNDGPDQAGSGSQGATHPVPAPPAGWPTGLPTAPPASWQPTASGSHTMTPAAPVGATTTGAWSAENGPLTVTVVQVVNTGGKVSLTVRAHDSAHESVTLPVFSYFTATDDQGNSYTAQPLAPITVPAGGTVSDTLTLEQTVPASARRLNVGWTTIFSQGPPLNGSITVRGVPLPQ